MTADSFGIRLRLVSSLPPKTTKPGIRLKR